MSCKRNQTRYKNKKARQRKIIQIVESIFDQRNNHQTYSNTSWILKSIENNTWGRNTHKESLSDANYILTLTDYATARNIVDLGLFDKWSKERKEAKLL